MKDPYNIRTRTIVDICIQVLFYAALLGGFWLLSFLIP